MQLRLFDPVKYISVAVLLIAGSVSCAIITPVRDTTSSLREINFRYENDHARTVELVGSFNDWKPGSTPLKKNQQGTWTATIRLCQGSYEYMFVIDGQKWVNDPKATEQISDGFGRTNSVVIVE